MAYTMGMHQRTWLTLLTFPLVAAFTYPVMFQPVHDAPARPNPRAAVDPLAGLSDIQDVLTLVRDNYVDVPDMEKVINGGIQGVLERSHPLNAYLTPEDLHLADPGPAGIGITVVKRQIYAQVIAVVPGCPAAKAGFQVSDMVRKLDGDSIGAMSAWTLERRLRGPAGSELSLLRYAAANGDLKKITVKRELVQPPPITVRKDPRANVVALADLTPGRAAELKALLPGLDHKLPLVLDLRQCAGGGLPEAALVVPHCNFSFMDEAGPGGLAVRARVLAACERLLLRCDGLILCGQELTEGMAMERAAAIAAGLPIVQLPEAPRVVQAGRLPSTTVLLKSIQRLGVAASCDAASRRCSSSLGSQR